MRLFGLALWGALTLVNADANVTHESRNVLRSTFTPPQHFQNVDLVRHINLAKNYPRETINVVIENVHTAAQSHYYLPFELGTIARIGGVEVRDKKTPKKPKFDAEVAEYGADDATEYYKITFPEPLEPKQQLTLQINYYTLSALEPLPSKISQSEKQYVLYKFSAYAPSAYKTLKQKTKLKLPTSDVPDAVTLPSSQNLDGKEDPQKSGTSYTYGPYGEREPGSVQEVSVRYEFTKSLMHSKLLERDIEVSQWGGNIATEERHWLGNRAAGLKNHFSRLEYQKSAYHNPATSAIQGLRFPLAGGTADAYFVDDIGNVSLSAFTTSKRDALLDLSPRYPVYGGWNYSFKVGWNGELHTHLRQAKGTSSGYVLKVKFLEGPQPLEGIEYERVVTRVILPEGATNVKFETTVPLVSNSTGLHHTFMDTLGRTTLTLTAINTVDEFRDRDLIVTYDYPASAMYRKPFAIFGAIATLFVVSWVVGNVDVSIGKKK